MKILCVSDSHGDMGSLYDAVAENIENIGILLFLGDGMDEFGEIQALFPKLEYAAVRGNCDSSRDFPCHHTLILHGVKIVMTHGHLFGVKRELDTLAAYGREQEADLVLFGHTHARALEQRGEMILFNPGSICTRRTSIGPSYGIIEIADGKVVSCEHREVQQ